MNDQNKDALVLLGLPGESEEREASGVEKKATSTKMESWNIIEQAFFGDPTTLKVDVAS